MLVAARGRNGSPAAEGGTRVGPWESGPRKKWMNTSHCLLLLSVVIPFVAIVARSPHPFKLLGYPSPSPHGFNLCRGDSTLKKSPNGRAVADEQEAHTGMWQETEYSNATQVQTRLPESAMSLCAESSSAIHREWRGVVSQLSIVMPMTS